MVANWALKISENPRNGCKMELIEAIDAQIDLREVNLLAYYGESFHSLDSAKRLIVPTRFRDALGNEIIVFKAEDGCLFLYDTARFDEITAQLDAYSRSASEREKLRLFYSCVTQLSVDRTGRIVLPADCLEHAGITTEVALLGAKNRIELWDKETYIAKTGDKAALPASMFPEIEM